jgi:hypothetical protein
MAMATALRKLSANALRRQPLSRITPLYYMVRHRLLLLVLIIVARRHGGHLSLSLSSTLPTPRKKTNKESTTHDPFF